jgi:hypothetical protein
MTTLPYALRRVYADGGEEPVSDHPTFGDGWSAGQHAVHEDRENAYALYRGQRRPARFSSGRLMRHAGTGYLPAPSGAGS